MSGLTTDTNIIEYREGKRQHGTVRKLPGLMKYDNIVAQARLDAATRSSGSGARR